MEEINNNEEFQYIKERVKQRPLNRKKLVRRMVITASMAVIFGVLACFTFLVLEPVFTNLLYPENKAGIVVIPDDEDEILPEDMMLQEESQKTTIQVIEQKSIQDPLKLYEEQYEKIYSIAQKAVKSLVTVTSVTQDLDWFNNEYESKGTSSAVYVAKNGKELLILAYTDKIANSDNITVTFYDGSVVKGEIKQSDTNTGLSIIAVLKEDVPSNTLSNIETAYLANSRVSNLLASPVIAVGRPYGSSESVGYGILTSKGSYAYLCDQNYEILRTDIYGSTDANGVIVNLKGEVLGIINQKYSQEGSSNLISAIGISDIKRAIERMSNGKERACLGIIGMDISDEIIKSQGVPDGAFVKSILMGSPAMKAGIQSGDVIVKIGNTEIINYKDVQEALITYEPDMTVTVKLKRQGGEEYGDIDVEVNLKNL